MSTVRLSKLLVLFAVLVVSSAATAVECVVLLHGLARSADSMKKLERRLSDERYAVVNVDYPSRKHSIQVLAEMAVGKGVSGCEQIKPTKINFVTHSLGGILVRAYFKTHNRDDIGRVVMLGPPNQGSEVVDSLRDAPGFELINGPAGMQLGTGALDMPKKLGPVNFELGVIAGTQSINLILSAFLPNPDDGKVSVESTKVEGMADFIALPATHPFLMKNDAVIEQTVEFLKHGRFKKGSRL